ncbi:MAG TPA: hypothetical protein VLR90_13830 [Blastocatellia bacterium]|nr:hypothetical protein [Blastocatellia bacterium]
MSDTEGLVWEPLASSREDKRWFNSDWHTFRAKVPGGWLVVVRIEGGLAVSPSVTFYPDPEHEWDGNSLE